MCSDQDGPRRFVCTRWNQVRKSWMMLETKRLTTSPLMNARSHHTAANKRLSFPFIPRHSLQLVYKGTRTKRVRWTIATDDDLIESTDRNLGIGARVVPVRSRTEHEQNAYVREVHAAMHR